jgi:hypothetical protein
MTQTTTHVYTHTHSATYLSDKMSQILKTLLVNSGLNPQRLVEAWQAWVHRAACAWLESEHLLTIIIEFYEPGSREAADRWDFPIHYGTGEVDEMWTDREHLSGTLPKAPRPSSTLRYRVVLEVKAGHPVVEGVTETELLDIGGKTARSAGTVVATPHMTAGVRYYK